MEDPVRHSTAPRRPMPISSRQQSGTLLVTRNSRTASVRQRTDPQPRSRTADSRQRPGRNSQRSRLRVRAMAIRLLLPIAPQYQSLSSEQQCCSIRNNGAISRASNLKTWTQPLREGSGKPEMRSRIHCECLELRRRSSVSGCARLDQCFFARS